MTPPTPADFGWLLRGQALFGLLVFVLAAWLYGRFGTRKLDPATRPRTPWRVVGYGLALQFGFALLVLKTTPGKAAFGAVDRGVRQLLAFATEGASFLFGGLATGNNLPVGTPLDPAGPAFSPLVPLAGTGQTYAAAGAFFAFNVLPVIIFFSSLLAVLYHTGLMRLVVGSLAWAMRRTMGTSGAETLSASANIFVGQTEAPLFVRPFLAAATQSELFAVMVGGFANIASGVLGVYAGLLVGLVPDAAGHLLAASLISAPAGLVVAKLMVPETEVPVTAGGAPVPTEKVDVNLIDAAARGALEGLTLALNVGAVLIAFVGLIALLNALIGLLGPTLGFPATSPDTTLTLQKILGRLLAPVAWLCGVPWRESGEVGTLVGIKTVLNEFLGYLRLSDGLRAQAQGGPAYLSPRTSLIAVYALCGFANFSSVAIQIGGIGALAPSRRQDLSRLGLAAMVGGTVASLMTACVVGVLIGG